MHPLLRSLALVPLALTAGCVIAIGRETSWLDGGGWSDLDHEHVETLALDAQLEHLQVRTGSGDVQVGAAGGHPRIVATIREQEAGDGFVELVDGVLCVRSRSGQDVALGHVQVHLEGATGTLDLATGSGDLRVSGADVRASLVLSTGSGDVELASVGSPARVTVGTGSGSIQVAGLASRRLDLSTGSGDILVADVECDEAVFESGSGDVRATNSTIGKLRADTGSGDLDLRGARSVETSFRTGSGSIRLDAEER